MAAAVLPRSTRLADRRRDGVLRSQQGDFPSARPRGRWRTWRRKTAQPVVEGAGHHRRAHRGLGGRRRALGPGLTAQSPRFPRANGVFTICGLPHWPAAAHTVSIDTAPPLRRAHGGLLHCCLAVRQARPGSGCAVISSKWRRPPDGIQAAFVASCSKTRPIRAASSSSSTGRRQPTRSGTTPRLRTSSGSTNSAPMTSSASSSCTGWPV